MHGIDCMVPAKRPYLNSRKLCTIDMTLLTALMLSVGEPTQSSSARQRCRRRIFHCGHLQGSFSLCKIERHNASSPKAWLLSDSTKCRSLKVLTHLLLTYQSTLLTFNFEKQIQDFLHQVSKVEELYDDLVVHLRVPQIFEERFIEDCSSSPRSSKTVLCSPRRGLKTLLQPLHERRHSPWRARGPAAGERARRLWEQGVWRRRL
jgi:hypothetical protein